MIERLRKDDVIVHRARFAPDALIVTEGHPLRGDGLDAGWFVVQDEASQLVTLLAGVDPGALVLDTCASPGGKTTALAAGMQGRGLLVACDVRDRRMDLLRRTVAASGATNVRLAQADLLRPLPFVRAFDCVFVDAPCSGLGTLRRDPDIKWRRQEDDLPALAAAQLEMLRNAARCGRAGRTSRLCDLFERAGRERIGGRRVPGRRGRFPPVDLAASTPVPPAVINARGHLRTYPHVHGLEAFFGAVFVRRGQT